MKPAEVFFPPEPDYVGLPLGHEAEKDIAVTYPEGRPMDPELEEC